MRFALFIIVSLLVSCQHKSVLDPSADPDNPLVVSDNCDPDTVYFNNQVLPVLISNCTQSGCHNATDKEDGVDLSSYYGVLSTVEHILDTDWSENKLIRVLVDSDPDERMPYERDPLPQDQIELLKTWIKQGALHNGCNDNGNCNTLNVTYNNFVKSLIQSQCTGCHGGSAPSAGLNLTQYAQVKTAALNGKLYSWVNRSSGWMPQGGQKLSQCNIDKLKSWAENGAPEN
jgi:cytochrome c553